MYLSRTIDQVLLQWSRPEPRKPLILRGARQTGKTEAVRRLGSSFELFIELNLERFDDLSLVRASNSADDLLVALRARLNISSIPDNTLLFIDEIQESAKAITWLRFLYEDHPQLAVIGAGSLMEVRLQEKGFSFPVGRVTFRTLRPLTFFEVMRASGRDVLAQNLEQAVAEDRPIPAPLKIQAQEMLRTYLQVGGMPEATARWVETQDPGAARQVHLDLLQSLAEDLHRYKGIRDLSYLEAAFENLRHHYGLRFKYENFAPGYRSQLMQTALLKMESALLISRVHPTSSLQIPLQVRRRSAPKLLPLDTALALTSMGFDAREMSRSPVGTVLGGRIAEMYAGQELLAASQSSSELFFWVSESSRGNAEVDFLVPRGSELLPIEVKASAAGSLKSLHQFLWRSGQRDGIRLHEGESGTEKLSVKMPDGQLEYRLRSLPLWAAYLLRQ
jgi:hypothetical protein